MLSRRKKIAPAHARRSNLEPLENRVLFAIAVAENLLVNIDATTLPAGSGDNVANTGSLGGVFQATGGDPSTVPTIDRPVTGATSGTQGIRFDGTDFLQLVNSATDSTLITAPAGITGTDPTVSIETWVWNPGIPAEETQVSWGHRGGPDGTNMSFNYGNHNLYGAVGHWGSPDAGWGPPEGPLQTPAAKQWHHLVYTYDGTATHLYVDGAPIYTEVLGPGVINTWADTAINLATQLEPDGLTPTAGLRGSLTLGRVRIHDGVLTDAEVAANYNAEKADFVEPVVPVVPPPPANLLVSIDATTLPEGEANDIPNTGPLGGVFEATGGAGTIPVIDTPITDATGGTRGIVFDGTAYMQLVNSAADSTLITAPASITGHDPASSIETWVWNPGIASEETQASWGNRGGPDGSNYSFNYGSNGTYGAMGHWGSPDMGWTTSGADGAPAARHWHHLVYTFDGQGVQRVYVDGVQANSEDLGPGALNIHPDTAINLATQLEPDGVTPTAPLRGTLTLGKVRIYSGTLTDAQIATNYNNEKAQFVEPTAPPPPPAQLLVSVDATTLAPGTPANDIPNTGPLGGVFEATGGAGTIPVVAPPLTGSTTGTPGIRLDGNDYLQLVNSPTDATLITAPASITGVDPKRSMEAWVYNPGIANEETMVSFGHRGGNPDGSNVSFNYGSNGAWGALGEWGAPDIGWDPSGVTPHAPAARQWHHVAYTYDGATTRIYVDGALVNTEDLGPGAVNTFPDTAINIGTQLEPDGVTPTEFLKGSLTLGKVRIYEGVLTDAQIANNYNTEKASFVNPTDPAPTTLSKGPIHRYSFNNTAGDATGATITDSVGTANGTVQGAGATFNGTRLLLPGGSSASAAYVDLPNGILSSLGAANGGTGKLTFEGWVKNTGNQSWSRFYDFGTGTAGELTGPGGGPANGVDFFMLTAQTGADSIHRFETTENADGDSTGNRWDEVTSPTNQDLHFAVTWDETTGQVKYYENGKEVGGLPSGVLINTMNDINNWLGRSQFTADSNLQGEYDEFRIYDHALTSSEVAGDFLAGPDVVNTATSGVHVSKVFVNGTNLTNNAAFRAAAGADAVFGYPIPDGANQLRAIPWSAGVNQVSIQFDQDVAATLDQADLAVRGSGGTIGTTAFTYDAPSKTGTWTLGSTVNLDKLRLVLAAAGVTGLDGDWVNPSTATPAGDTYPSGDGTAGGDFNFRINVLRGDATGDGVVNALDVADVKKRLTRRPGDGVTGSNAYSIFADVNSDGVVNALDVAAVKARLGNRITTLPDPATALLFA